MNQDSRPPLHPATELRRRAGVVLLVVVVALTGWFFYRVWSNVATLAGRTLPGVGYAAELLDRGADMEISRQARGNSPELRPEQRAGFAHLLARYESTVVNDQDRANLQAVRDAYANYQAGPGGESWQRLRAELRTLHAFRHQRAMAFASESKERFSSALITNVVGLALFTLLSLAVTIHFAMTNTRDARPDDF